MTAEELKLEQAKLLKQANTRLIVGVLAMLVITASAVFVLERTLRTSDDDASRVTQDGITCLLEQLNEHRQNSFAAHGEEAVSRGETLSVPAPGPPPVPQSLIAACDRFFQAPK